MKLRIVLFIVLMAVLPTFAQDVDIPSVSSTETFSALNTWIIPFFEPGAAGDEARSKTYSQIKSDIVSQTTIYDQVKNIIVGGTNATATDDDTAQTVTIASSGSGSGGVTSIIAGRRHCGRSGHGRRYNRCVERVHSHR